MDTWVTIVVAILGSGLINTLLNYGITVHERKRSDEDGTKEASRLLMKNEIRRLCDTYISQGWIYEDELEDLIVMHKCYHNKLGGNGFLDEMMLRVKKLEIKGVR